MCFCYKSFFVDSFLRKIFRTSSILNGQIEKCRNLWVKPNHSSIDIYHILYGTTQVSSAYKFPCVNFWSPLYQIRTCGWIAYQIVQQRLGWICNFCAACEFPKPHSVKHRSRKVLITRPDQWSLTTITITITTITTTTTITTSGPPHNPRRCHYHWNFIETLRLIFAPQKLNCEQAREIAISNLKLSMTHPLTHSPTDWQG